MPEVPSSTIQPGESHSNAAEQGTNLADIILEQIAVHEAAQQASQKAEPIIYGGGVLEDAIELPAKVVEVYTKWEFINIKDYSSTNDFIGLDLYYQDSSPESFPSHLRLSHHSHSGRIYFQLLGEYLIIYI